MQPTIYPHKGIDNITFGMNQTDIEGILGNPSEIEEMDNANDEASTLLHYDNLGLTFFLEGKDMILTCIDVSNPESRLFEEEIFSLTEQQIVAILVQNNSLEQDSDEESWGERRVSFPQSNLDFFFEQGQLVSIVVGQ